MGRPAASAAPSGAPGTATSSMPASRRAAARRLADRGPAEGRGVDAGAREGAEHGRDGVRAGHGDERTGCEPRDGARRARPRPRAGSRWRGRARRRCPAAARAASSGPACPAGRPTSGPGRAPERDEAGREPLDQRIRRLRRRRAPDPADRRRRDRRRPGRRHPVARRRRDDLQRLAGRACRDPDRRPAAAAGPREDRALRLDLQARRRVVDPGDRVPRLRVVGAHLDRERALARRRRDRVERQDLVDAVRPAEPREPGDGEDEGVGLAVVQAPEPRVHVAVERVQDEVGSLREHERRAPRAVGAHAGARRERRQRPSALAADAARRAGPRGPGTRR